MSSSDRGHGDAERICEECGNDLACEGYRFCSDCLEELVPGPPTTFR